MLHIFQFLPNQTNFREKPVSFSKNTPKVAQNDFYDHLDHSKNKNFGELRNLSFFAQNRIFSQNTLKNDRPIFSDGQYNGIFAFKDADSKTSSTGGEGFFDAPTPIFEIHSPKFF